MSTIPGENRKRTITVGFGGLDTISENPPTPVEYGRTLLGTSSFGIAASSATATGSCDLTATPGC